MSIGLCKLFIGNNQRPKLKMKIMPSDGEYLVYSVEHDFSVQDGYFTTCHLKRNFCGASLRKNVSEIDRERIDSQSANAQEETAAAASASGNQTETQNSTEENNAEKKNPSITNPHWENADGKAIAKALVGDEVYLCADVTDIADGAAAKIRIVEKDDDGSDDFVTELNTSVQDGKIRRKWKVIYTEDNDDTDSQQELEENGYTLPEYAFTVECDGMESEESGQLDVRGWIKRQLKDKQSGRPLKNLKYKILTTDNKILFTGVTDENGFLEWKNIKNSNFSIIFEV